MGKVYSINLSENKGTMKKPVNRAELVSGEGVLGDSHSEPGPRAISLMMLEDIERSREDASADALAALSEQGIELGPGAYAENLTTSGLDLHSIEIGDELVIGGSVRLKVSGIGKKCHQACEIRTKLGDCIFPRVGIFAEVLEGGAVEAGDSIEKG